MFDAAVSFLTGHDLRRMLSTDISLSADLVLAALAPISGCQLADYRTTGLRSGDLPRRDWDEAVSSFRTVVGSLDADTLVKLVKFATGLAHTAGPGSISVLPFSRSYVNDTDRLMQASACDSVLRIPVSFRKSNMRQVVLDSLEEGLAGGFQLR
jgi:hypothetical protein